jgi:hypothetical protein
MVNLSQELDLWCFEGEVICEIHVYDKLSSKERCPIRSVNGEVPVEKIISNEADSDSGNGVGVEIL